MAPLAVADWTSGAASAESGNTAGVIVSFVNTRITPPPGRSIVLVDTQDQEHVFTSATSDAFTGQVKAVLGDGVAVAKGFVPAQATQFQGTTVTWFGPMTLPSGVMILGCANAWDHSASIAWTSQGDGAQASGNSQAQLGPAYGSAQVGGFAQNAYEYDPASSIKSAARPGGFVAMAVNCSNVTFDLSALASHLPASTLPFQAQQGYRSLPQFNVYQRQQGRLEVEPYNAGSETPPFKGYLAVAEPLEVQSEVGEPILDAAPVVEQQQPAPVQQQVDPVEQQLAPPEEQVAPVQQEPEPVQGELETGPVQEYQPEVPPQDPPQPEEAPTQTQPAEIQVQPAQIEPQPTPVVEVQPAQDVVQPAQAQVRQLGPVQHALQTGPLEVRREQDFVQSRRRVRPVPAPRQLQSQQPAPLQAYEPVQGYYVLPEQYQDFRRGPASYQRSEQYWTPPGQRPRFAQYDGQPRRDQARAQYVHYDTQGEWTGPRVRARNGWTGGRGRSGGGIVPVLRPRDVEAGHAQDERTLSIRDYEYDFDQELE